MDENRRLEYISYGLHRKMNDIIGPEKAIQARRSITNLGNDFETLNSTLSCDLSWPHLSGSFAEGFRFKSSDMDYMFIHRHIKVISDCLHGAINGDTSTVLVMETEGTRPGFALLRLVSQAHHPLVLRSRILLPGGVYLSSFLWKEAVPKTIPNDVSHGPCINGMYGDMEVDFADCLRCCSWPKSAIGCIARLQKTGWPSTEVLKSIVKECCHLVAIGGKGSQYEQSEWRISFSFAEKTLIHNMSHCQFLCYGLLKIFLKEAIEKDSEEKLLCSYFIKTAVFWEVCDRQIVWNAYNLLNCFWNCFRRLISWVSNGYCPNFFIPENNMFYGKIQGRAQSQLLNNLSALYKEGHYCLLKCPSLQPFYTKLLGITSQPFLCLMFPPENEVYSKSYYDCHIIREVVNEMPKLPFSVKLISVLFRVLSLLTDQGDATCGLTLSIWKRSITQQVGVMSLCETNFRILSNKGTYRQIQRLLRALKNQSVDLCSHLVLSTIFLSRFGLYQTALKVLLRAKNKLQRPNVMYDRDLNLRIYREAGGEEAPLVAMLKKNVAFTLHLPIVICIPELALEHQAALHVGTVLGFPPLVVINFLLYLSHYYMGQFAEAGEVLGELEVLVVYDDGSQIHHTERAISWTMLGICQEMSGQLTKALSSYTEALNDRYKYIEDAARLRLENVLLKLSR